MSAPDPEAPADAPQAADPVPAAPSKESIRKALRNYRILAWTTGVLLIALCYEMVVKYVMKVEDIPYWLTLVPFVHGWVYFVYLLFTGNLAVKVRWPLPKTIGVLLSGTIPLAGVIVEHFQTKQLKAQFGL